MRPASSRPISSDTLLSCIFERRESGEVTNQEFQKKGSQVHPDWKVGRKVEV